jgi:hypothetical protein
MRMYQLENMIQQHDKQAAVEEIVSKFVNKVYFLITVQTTYSRFQVLMAVGMKMTAFWDITPCSLVEVDRRFRGVYCPVRVMMEAALTSETSVYFNKTARHHIPECCHLHTYSRHHYRTGHKNLILNGFTLFDIYHRYQLLAFILCVSYMNVELSIIKVDDTVI